MSLTRDLTELGLVPPLAKLLAEAIAAGPGPVTSVNGDTGVVVLDASDVGALADNTTAADIGAVAIPDTPPAYSTDAADLAAALVAAGLMAAQ